jgi:Cd2+/Zn2+-exporting ATPase
MLTGDREEVAISIAKEVGVNEVHHSLLPGQKAEIIAGLQKAKKKGESVLFAGDGINDAPSLVCADVGVAMGNKGTSVAVESADVVLMYDDIRGIVTAKKIARKTMRIVKQNIIFALGVKIGIMIITAIFPASMWLAVFADVGVSLIAILNAMRTLKIR